jgi:hypothetical protein
MKSKLTASFVKAYGRLDPEIRERARRAYREWRANEKARRFKQVGEDVSVRIDRNYRALGYIENDTVFWYWIGKHDEYDQKLG